MRRSVCLLGAVALLAGMSGCRLMHVGDRNCLTGDCGQCANCTAADCPTGDCGSPAYGKHARSVPASIVSSCVGRACGGHPIACATGHVAGCDAGGSTCGKCRPSIVDRLRATHRGHVRRAAVPKVHRPPEPPVPGPPTGTVTYPYYTLRGPRDFLVDDPPRLGR